MHRIIMYSDSSHSVLAICETKHAKAKYWISIKSMKKMGEERKRTKQFCYQNIRKKGAKKPSSNCTKSLKALVQVKDKTVKYIEDMYGDGNLEKYG